MGIGSGAVAGWDVCDEHGWERRRVAARELRHGKLGLVEIGVSFAGSAGDLDGCAVHVHLTVADLVEPGPCERVCPRSDTLRDRIVVRVRVWSVGILSKITRSIFRRATALDRVDDHPFGALRCRVVGGERDLTRTTTMYSLAREGQFLCGADGHVGDGSSRVACGFAGEVGTVGNERAVVGTAVWGRSGHHHMRMGCAGESSDGRSRKNCLDGRHVDLGMLVFLFFFGAFEV